MTERRACRGAIGLLLLGWAVLGCREPPAEITLPPLPELVEPRDASVPIPDGAVPCRVHEDCDDGIECTRDACAPGGYCVHAGDSSRCSDGVYCNGQEICDRARGCRPGAPRRCNDDNVCTLDSCDEANKRCRHEPRDFDEDGEVDWHCLGGTDCDDFDATRANGRMEVCGDGVDNDCDDRVDEVGCGRVEHDSCEDALDVSKGGRFQIDAGGAASDYTLTCGELGAKDVAFTFTLDEPKDVTLVASALLRDGSDEIATLSLRRACSDVRTEVECHHGFPGQVRVRALQPGRYYAIASSLHAASMVLDVRFDDPTEPPANQTCESPLDISAGGRFEGSFVDVSEDAELACAFSNATDLFYSFTLEEERDVELSAISLSGRERLSFAVRRACDDPATTMRCLSGAPARARLHQLEAGTYYVVLEGSSAREIDFSLEVAVLDPTPPPPGDSCDAPLELPIGTRVDGTLANRQDLVPLRECGCNPDIAEAGCDLFLPNAVYRLEVDEPTDLQLAINARSGLVAYELRSVCESNAAQLACRQGEFIDVRIRNLTPGDYYLILESAEATPFTVELTNLPRTMPVPVGGNDRCATAIDIPQEGGLFTGDTLGMLNDYGSVCGSGANSGDAAFRLVLPRRSRVVATLEAAFDTVLTRYPDIAGEGPSACAGLSEFCSDDGGLGTRNSLLDEVLEAGTHYYIVDGFNDGNQGTYLLDVSVVPQ